MEGQYFQGKERILERYASSLYISHKVKVNLSFILLMLWYSQMNVQEKNKCDILKKINLGA